MATDTRRLRVIVTGDSGDAQQAIEAVGDAAQDTEKKVSTWGSRFQTVTGLVAKAAAVAGALAAGLFGFSAIQKGLDRLATIEDATAALTVTLGSAAKAAQFMDGILEVVRGTPFNLDQFATAGKNLVVFGVAADKVPGYLKAIGEAAAASGAGAEAVGTLVNAFGDAAAVGRITGDTLMSLAQQGVPALQILANGYGVTTAQMRDMVSKGMVPATKGMDLLTKGIMEGTDGAAGSTVKLGGSMELLRKTFRGALGGMGAAVARFGAAILGPFMGDMTTGLTGLADATDKAGARVKAALTEVAASPFWQSVRQNLKELPTLVDTAFAKFGTLADKVQSALSTVQVRTDTFERFERIFANLSQLASELEGPISRIGASLGRATAAVGISTWELLLITLEALSRILLVTLVPMMEKLATFMEENQGVVNVLVGAYVAWKVATLAQAVALNIKAAALSVASVRTSILTAKTNLIEKATKAWTKAQLVWSAVMSAPSNLKFLAFATKYQFVTKVMPALTKAWAASQAALNVVMSLNPIGLVVAAIVILIGIIALLWTKNEGFRKAVIASWEWIKKAAGAVADFFMNYVWPVIQRALGFLLGYYKFVWNLITTIAGAVASFFMSVVWPLLKTVFNNISNGLNLLYNVVWKPIWILIQIAAKIAAFYFQNVIMPIFKFVFSGIMLVVNTFVAGWQFWWGIIKKAAGAVADWFNNTIVPSLRKAFDQLMGIVNWFKDRWNSIWGGIKKAAGAVSDWFTGTIVPSLRKAFDQLMAFLGFLKTGWDREWGRMRKIVDTVTSAFAKAFKWAKDEIGREWAKLKDIAKKPVSFMVNTVYNNGIRKLWNTVAEKFGISTRLDSIKFAKGGVLPGYAPRKDRVPAVLSPGEGVAVPELIKQIGVNRFLDWNKKAREGRPIAFADGGIVGWGKNLLSKGKDIIQGIASPVVNKLIDGLKPIVNAIPGTGGFSNMMRSGGHKLLDNFKSWVAGKDKAALDLGTHLSGTAGGKKMAGMGWQMQMWYLRNRFPGLQLISGFRPGARTLSGNRSYHSLGRAVDVPPRKDVFNWIKGTFGPAIKELIFSPMGKGQVHNGRNHYYREPIRGQHWDHVHWAMDNGGVLPPNSTTTVTNATSRREYMLTEDKLQRLGGVNIENLNVTVEGDISDAQAQKAARKIRDELVKLGNRNGGRPALTPAS